MKLNRFTAALWDLDTFHVFDDFWADQVDTQWVDTVTDTGTVALTVASSLSSHAKSGSGRVWRSYQANVSLNPSSSGVSATPSSARTRSVRIVIGGISRYAPK